MQIESLNKLEKFVDEQLKLTPDISKTSLIRKSIRQFAILSPEIISLKINKIFFSRSNNATTTKNDS